MVMLKWACPLTIKNEQQMQPPNYGNQGMHLEMGSTHSIGVNTEIYSVETMRRLEFG